MTARPLRVVQPDENSTSPALARPKIAQLLRDVAAVTESGAPWSLAGEDRDPVCAAIVITFGPDGEPTPMLAGIDGENWSSSERYHEIVADVSHALHDLRPMRVIFGGRESEPVPPYVNVRERWTARDEGRRRARDERAAARERYEAEYPWICDCGKRLKSERGLPAHVRGREHRIWVERKARS